MITSSKTFISDLLDPAKKGNNNFFDKVFRIYLVDDLSIKLQINEIIKAILNPEGEKRNWVYDIVI